MFDIIKKHKFLVFITCVLGVIASLSMVISALMLANLLNVVMDKDIIELFKQTGILVGVWVFTMIINYLSEVMIEKSIKEMNQTLRGKIVNKLISMEYEEFNEKDTGSYISWLTNDITQIETIGFMNFFNLINQASTVIFSLIGLFTLNYLISLVAFLICIVMLIIPKLLNKLIQKSAEEMTINQENFVKKIKETVQGHEVFYSYNLLGKFSKSILESSRNVENSKYKLKKIKIINLNLIIFSNICAQIIMMFVAGYLTIIGKTLVGSVIAAADLSGTFFRSFASMINCFMEIHSSKPIWDKFKFDNKVITSNSGKSFEFNNSIRLENINFSYENKKIFSDLSLTFEKGKKYAIVGESGSGKTTLIKLILGHLKNYDGDIYIDGKKIKEVSDKNIMDNISYISQNVYVFNDTIKNNITLNEDFDKSLIDKALNDSCLTDFVSEFENGIDTIVEENGKNISGGQKQRIAIARSLIRNKSIIILDEGTSALDKKNSFEIESSLLNQKESTIIFISHNINSELMNRIDEIINLDSIKEEYLV